MKENSNPFRMPRPVEVATLVIKVSSRCNMDCDYCYIYHGEDSSWRDMPETMEPSTSKALVSEIAHLYNVQKTKPQIVFHGGEPLLFGIRKLRKLIGDIILEVPTVFLSIQTNGTIYNSDLEELLLEFRDNLSFSVSADGYQPENDRHRLGLRKNSVFKTIDSTLQQANRAGVLDNILIVIDIRNSPNRIYQFMLDSGAKSYNILLQDGDHDHFPPGKNDTTDIRVGRWLWELFKLYSQGMQTFKLKLFDDISLSILKKSCGFRPPPATYSLCTMTIDTNGEIKQADTYRINSNRGDRIIGENIKYSSLTEAANSRAHREFLDRSERLSTTCNSCEYLNACGGGYPSHRFKSGCLENPSVYCSDYLYLFKNIERALCC